MQGRHARSRAHAAAKEYGTVPDFSNIEEKTRLWTNVAFSRPSMFCQHLVRKLSLSVSAIVLMPLVNLPVPFIGEE